MAITTPIAAGSGWNTRATVKNGSNFRRSAQFGTLGTDSVSSNYLASQNDSVNHDNSYKRSYASSGTIPGAGNEVNVSLPNNLENCTIINRGAVPFYILHNYSNNGAESYDGSGSLTLASGESIIINQLTFSLAFRSDTNTSLDGYYEVFGPAYWNKDLM